MLEDDNAFRGAVELGGHDKIFFTQRQKLPPHHTRQPRPANQRENDHNAKVGLDYAPGGRQGDTERHPERQGGNGADKLDDTLDNHIDRAAKVAGDAAHHHADQRTDGNAHQPNRQGDARSIDNARQEIAPAVIGAKEMNFALGHAE